MYSAREAKRVVRLGQVNRRVFGTVANKESSRSHAIMTVRVERVKGVKGGGEDQVSWLGVCWVGGGLGY